MCGSLDDLMDAYNGILSDLADKHAPLTAKTITLRPNAPWWTMELAQAKRTRRSLEHIWRRSEKHEDLLKYRQQCVLTNQLIQKTRQNFYSVKVERYGKDQKAVFKVAENLLGHD